MKTPDGVTGLPDCIVNYWPEWFRALYGGSWPVDYCAIDVETTGLDPGLDVITEWGHCLVRDGEVQEQVTLVLDWTRHKTVPDDWLRGRLKTAQRQIELAGGTFSMSYERMQAEGRRPEEALSFIRDVLARVREAGIPFVAHHASFDEQMLDGNFAGFCIADGFRYDDNGFFDTAAIEKANQLVGDRRVHPLPGDTLRSYFQRVQQARSPGVRSNLDRHCYQKYRFGEKHGIARQEMHSALTDALCCRLLMEEYRALLLPGAPLPLPATAVAGPLPESLDGGMEGEEPGADSPPVAGGLPSRLRGQRNS
jgi:DNA polymerase III epsilon subunit-like protein